MVVALRVWRAPVPPGMACFRRELPVFEAGRLIQRHDNWMCKASLVFQCLVAFRAADCSVCCSTAWRHGWMCYARLLCLSCVCRIFVGAPCGDYCACIPVQTAEVPSIHIYCPHQEEALQFVWFATRATLHSVRLGLDSIWADLNVQA